MTPTDRNDVRAEVEAARRALTSHLSELEEAINFPKRVARWAHAKPAFAVAAGLAAAAALSGIVIAATRLARR